MIPHNVVLCNFDSIKISKCFLYQDDIFMKIVIPYSGEHVGVDLLSGDIKYFKPWNQVKSIKVELNLLNRWEKND